MKQLKFVFLLLGCCLMNSCQKKEASTLNHSSPLTPVFQQGESGYACFRIPAIVKTISGTLLAFAEGRKGGCSDTGDIDLVLKRSLDDGKTWSPLSVVWDDSLNTCGNPAPIVDKQTEQIFLLATWNLGIDKESQIIDQTSQSTRHVFVLQSTDEGMTWSTPRDITSQVKKPEWAWYATGPGSGSQLENEPYKGRLIVGCDHVVADTKKGYSHAIFSDDHGQTWNLGGSSPKDATNESEIAELQNGTLMLNMRSYNHEFRYRQSAISIDGGITWTNQQKTSLIEPICQASLQNFNNILLFSNPAHQTKRVNMCVRVSKDNGVTWSDSITIHPGPSAYSDLVVINKTAFGCLFEAGQESPYEQIVFTNLNYE